MKRKAAFEIAWKSVLCGFLYELFYQLALALRWITITETYSYIVAAVIGVAIALIICQRTALQTFIATLCGLASALVFEIIANRLDLLWKILVRCMPDMEVFGHTTINERMSIMVVFLGYTLISFSTFLITIGFMPVFSHRLWRKGS